MRARIEQELALLADHFPGVEHRQHAGEDWFRLPSYPFPAGWRIEDVAITAAPIVFKVGPAYPSSEPYGFYAPAGINFRGSTPRNPGSGTQPPFEGGWQHFSWAPDGSWVPANDVRQGSNLLAWVRGFAHRLREGA